MWCSSFRVSPPIQATAARPLPHSPTPVPQTQDVNSSSVILIVNRKRWHAMIHACVCPFKYLYLENWRSLLFFVHLNHPLFLLVVFEFRSTILIFFQWSRSHLSPPLHREFCVGVQERQRRLGIQSSGCGAGGHRVTLILPVGLSLGKCFGLDKSRDFSKPFKPERH